MNTFEEFLLDYEAHEMEETNRFLNRLDSGKVGGDERYPSKNRFINLKEPIADPYTNIWGVVPFYGSTLAKIIPKDSKKSFDIYHDNVLGFNSRNIDEMMDFQKETGKIQFILTSAPTDYKYMDFLEPLFTEFRPPIIQYDSGSVVGFDEDIINQNEFKKLAENEFLNYIVRITTLGGNSNPSYISTKMMEYASRYSVLKASGYDELVNEIKILMGTNPEKALLYLIVYGYLIANPKKSLLKPICHYGEEFMGHVNDLQNLSTDEVITSIAPPEIGKFLLNKLTLYPETMDGCKKIIQEYKDQELYQVTKALHEGVKKSNMDTIMESRGNLSDILDNVWNDTSRIKLKADGIKFGVSFGFGLIGGLCEGLSGLGVMAGLGYTASNTAWGMQEDSISEKIAKKVSPNHLVSIYDFKNKYSLKDE